MSSMKLIAMPDGLGVDFILDGGKSLYQVASQRPFIAWPPLMERRRVDHEYYTGKFDCSGGIGDLEAMAANPNLLLARTLAIIQGKGIVIRVDFAVPSLKLSEVKTLAEGEKDEWLYELGDRYISPLITWDKLEACYSNRNSYELDYFIGGFDLPDAFKFWDNGPVEFANHFQSDERYELFYEMSKPQECYPDEETPDIDLSDEEV